MARPRIKPHNLKQHEDMIDSLRELYLKMEKGEIDRLDAAEMANIAGKYWKGVALHLAHQALQLQVGQARVNASKTPAIPSATGEGD